MKGSSQIEIDFFNKIKSRFADIKGKAYRSGMRSVIAEDVVVTYKSGFNGQFQNGEVMIQVYVPDKSFKGSYTKDSARLREFENRFMELELTDGEYLISLINIPETISEEAIKQHYVLARYKFRRINFK